MKTASRREGDYGRISKHSSDIISAWLTSIKKVVPTLCVLHFYITHILAPQFF